MLRKLCITDNKDGAGQLASAVWFFALVLGITPSTTTPAPATATTEPHFLSLFNFIPLTVHKSPLLKSMST